MMKHIHYLVAVYTVLTLAACVPSTPQADSGSRHAEQDTTVHADDRIEGWKDEGTQDVEMTAKPVFE